MSPELGNEIFQIARKKFRQVINRQPYPVIGTRPSRIARLDSVLTTVLEKLDGASNKVDALLSHNGAIFSSGTA